jgi:toxin ParE1/3/4
VKVHISKRALVDLDQIYEYTESEWGNEQAIRYTAAIWRKFDEIGAGPERWRLRNDLYPGCRICYSSRHAIVYRIHGEAVEVARLLHGRMNFADHIPANFME